MNSKQIGKATMYMAVDDVLTSYKSSVDALPNSTGLVTNFRSGVKNVQLYGEMQFFNRGGVSDNKQLVRHLLAVLTEDAANRLYAYSRYAGNMVLMKEASMTENYLLRLSDVDLRNAAQGMYDRTQAYLTVLAVYGASVASQTALATAITNFTLVIPKTRTAAADKKQNTKLLADAFTATDDALEGIDALVELVKRTNVAFYTAYWAARVVVWRGGTSVSLRGVVRDAVSKVTIAGARVMLYPVVETLRKAMSVDEVFTDDMADAIEKRSADKGGFVVKSLWAGEYRMVVSKVGYDDVEQLISVNDEALCSVEVSLNRKNAVA